MLPSPCSFLLLYSGMPLPSHKLTSMKSLQDNGYGLLSIATAGATTLSWGFLSGVAQFLAITSGLVISIVLANAQLRKLRQERELVELTKREIEDRIRKSRVCPSCPMDGNPPPTLSR